MGIATMKTARLVRIGSQIIGIMQMEQRLLVQLSRIRRGN
jgi:hypothetical protein